ncbi:hypothetical protein F4779DRAFT_313475 [Xylariaceae sp. FL0662B]|nr:hypothetical protein F4779DRAFT_313475 [Xylariaceae sp. FL0662B]
MTFIPLDTAILIKLPVHGKHRGVSIFVVDKSQGGEKPAVWFYSATPLISVVLGLIMHQLFRHAGPECQSFILQYFHPSEYFTSKYLYLRKHPKYRARSPPTGHRLPCTEKSAERFHQQTPCIPNRTSSLHILPRWRYAGISKRRSASTPAYTIRTPRIYELEEPQVSHLRTTCSEDLFRQSPTNDNNVERGFSSVDEEYNDQRPPCSCSDAATRGRDLEVCDEDFWRSNIRIDVGDQRRSYKLLNPGSEYQANLEAVSPECKDLFTQCCPTPADQSDMKDEDDSVDSYWTWSIEKQQWFHADDECGTTVWFPKDFD